jgi:transposase
MIVPVEVQLTPAQRCELERIVRSHPKPYVRERASAVLKVAAGQWACDVAEHGLLRPRDRDTIYAWLKRFKQEGIPGLLIRPGRGRKPAFSPSLPEA